MDATNPNDYYAIGKLVCASCPVWEKCLKAGSSETWGMWGGLTPQERKGTVKVLHGTRETYRMGCECATCQNTPKEEPRKIDMSKIPNMRVTFDAKALLYDLTKP